MCGPCLIPHSTWTQNKEGIRGYQDGRKVSTMDCRGITSWKKKSLQTLNWILELGDLQPTSWVNSVDVRFLICSETCNMYVAEQWCGGNNTYSDCTANHHETPAKMHAKSSLENTANYCANTGIFIILCTSSLFLVPFLSPLLLCLLSCFQHFPLYLQTTAVWFEEWIVYKEIAELLHVACSAGEGKYESTWTTFFKMKDHRKYPLIH